MSFRYAYGARFGCIFEKREWEFESMFWVEEGSWAPAQSSAIEGQRFNRPPPLFLFFPWLSAQEQFCWKGMKRWFLIVRLLALQHWIEWSRLKAFGSCSTCIFRHPQKYWSDGIWFFQLSLNNSMIPITFSWWNKKQFPLFAFSECVYFWSGAAHPVLRCWPRVPLLQLPAAFLCVQQQSLSESQWPLLGSPSQPQDLIHKAK